MKKEELNPKLIVGFRIRASVLNEMVKISKLK